MATGKIASYQDIKDKADDAGVTMGTVGVNMKECPSKSDINDILLTPLTSKITISGDYDNNQLVKGQDITIEKGGGIIIPTGPSGSISLFARLKGTSDSVTTPYKGASWRITKLSGTADAMSGNLTTGLWMSNLDGYYDTPITTLHNANGTIEITINNVPYSATITSGTTYIQLNY